MPEALVRWGRTKMGREAGVLLVVACLSAAIHGGSVGRVREVAQGREAERR